MRCDDNDTYKGAVRAEIREWIKNNTVPPPSSKKSGSSQENHDAFEWLIVHVVIPNTTAATQPRTSSSKSESGTLEKTPSASRWGSKSTPLLEKLRADFNGSGKSSLDRVAQIRIGINDVPYDLLPRVVPAVPTGYSENEADAENAWKELMSKIKSQILHSFDMRVTQYEEDIKERDGQRALPGWNFCTFFILKEGLARGFESVGLVEDALVGYDELSVGLDSLFHNDTTDSTTPNLAIRPFAEDLKETLEKAAAGLTAGNDGDEEAVDLQFTPTVSDRYDAIAISATKKPYRDMILENKVSHFDFRCYIFSRQIELLLRLANVSSTREELLARLKEQQESVLYGEAPMAQATPQVIDEREDLTRLSEICQRALQFIPAITQIMRQDILAAWTSKSGADTSTGVPSEVVDNIVSSFAFSVAQQILAQTSTKALPIPPSALPPPEAHEQKASIPEPKTMMHPARTSSLSIRTVSRPPPSPNFFPGPGANSSELDKHNAQFAKAGLEDLAGRRAELYMVSRSVLENLGNRRGWSNGWLEAPMLGDSGISEMVDIDLDADETPSKAPATPSEPSMAGIESPLLMTAIDTSDDFYRLYEILTDKALRHYTVAGHEHSVQANKADLAVMKFHLKEYRVAAELFPKTTQFFGEGGWSLLELSMLVMYAQCLNVLQDKDSYVRVALKLLIMACAAEKERIRNNKGITLGTQSTQHLDMKPLAGVVDQLLELATGLQTDRKALLASFFTNAEIGETPAYDENKDGCSLTLQLQSLLSEEIKFESVKLRASTVTGGPIKELHFETAETVLQPGMNKIVVRCSSAVPGKYQIDRLHLRSGKLVLEWERDVDQQPDNDEALFKKAFLTLYQRKNSLEMSLKATKHTALDQNNSLDLLLSTGWNHVKSCELKVKPATGGLRLLATEAKIVNDGATFAKPPEAGAFFFEALPAGKMVTVRFPYTLEQDIAIVLVKLEAHYTLDSGETFCTAKTASVSVGLALGVNVQDVFKHQSLFSRFNVTTSTESPLRLFKSELIESDLFESSTGNTSIKPVTIFPKQSASLLYRVQRRQTAKSNSKSARTMYLKLYYGVLHDEIEEVIGTSVEEKLEGTSLSQYAKPLRSTVINELKKLLRPADLERAALLGDVSTLLLADVPWERHFDGFGLLNGSKEKAANALASFLRTWQKENLHLRVATEPGTDPSSILIPVEIPSVSVVHTADIRMQRSAATNSQAIDESEIRHVNEMIPASLHLKWTRIWDTNTAPKEDLEFSYEVSAASDVWLLGGRRKGHFVIPADSEVTSTAATEAEIPLILIPLREGWLPYPSVEIREVLPDGAEMVAQNCEVDFKNIGETIRVVDEKVSVTVSLDASGPGGGPLVLETEGPRGDSGRIVA